MIPIVSEGLSATVNPFGAELSSLRDGDGRDLLWDGDPAWWTGRAPLLFPIIGGLVDGAYRVGSTAYNLPKHGFARTRAWQVEQRTAAAVTLHLGADDETRAVYPFDFDLAATFAVQGATLTMVAVVTSRDAHPMTASFGFHPAFRWPLPYGAARDQHRLEFEADEPAPVRRLNGDDLLSPYHAPTPIHARVLQLDDALFVDDALIFDEPVSRRLRYGAPGFPGLDIAYDGLPQLGVWTKPGALFVCIEPWRGLPDPEGFAGDVARKPGVFTLAPGAEARFSMSVTVR